MIITKRQLRRIIREQMEAGWLEQLALSIQGTQFPGGFSAAWEYPGFIDIGKRGSSFSVAATPNWGAEDVIAVQVMTDDGAAIDGWDINVQWTGDVQQDAQLWQQAMNQAWPEISVLIQDFA